jgi:hypothetical protein
MKHHCIASIIAASASLLIAAIALNAQERFTLASPNGIGFSEFRGYEAWQVIAPSQTDTRTKVILGNPLMVKAYETGIPANGVTVPDGAMMAKVEWSRKANPFLPGAALVPDTLQTIGFMVKDAKRFADTDGWGYAQFDYDSAAGTFKARGSDPAFAKAACHQCHTRVKARDFVFTTYAER